MHIAKHDLLYVYSILVDEFNEQSFYDDNYHFCFVVYSSKLLLFVTFHVFDAKVLLLFVTFHVFDAKVSRMHTQNKLLLLCVFHFENSSGFL